MGKLSCGKPKNPPQLRKSLVETKCPNHCTLHLEIPLKDNQFRIDSNGTMCKGDNEGSNCSKVQKITRYDYINDIMFKI